MNLRKIGIVSKDWIEILQDRDEWRSHVATAINFRVHNNATELVILGNKALFTNIKYIQKSKIYDLLKSWLGEGLLTSTGAKWQKRRKILTPGFHFNVLQKYVEVLLRHGQNIVEVLKNEEGERIKNLQPWVSEHTLNIICETAMGVSFQNSIEEEKLKYKEAVNLISSIIIYRTVRPWLVSDLFFSWTSMGRKMNKTLKILHNFSTKIINERKKFHNDTNGKFLINYNSDDTEKIKMNNYSATVRMSMLDILIAAFQNGEVDDLGIREEVDTFIFEGYDTTAMAMSYIILCLAQYVEIQARAREEVDRIWKESEGKIGMSEIQKCTYLERCIKESLRLFPSVPIIARTVNEDLKLKNYVIPKGTVAHINIYKIHRDSHWWPNPTLFDPDRFLPENCKNRHPFSYIPFSGGFRNCIGQKLAMLELKTIIGFLLHNFIFEAIDKIEDIRIIADLVLKVKNPLRVKFTPIYK